MKGLTKYRLPGLLLAAVALYLLVQAAQLRLDLTADNRYTISQPVKKMLAGLTQPAEVVVLLEGDALPAGFRKLARSTESLLQQYRKLSQGKLSYRFMSAEAFLEDSLLTGMADTAKAAWLQANALKQNEVTQTGTKASFVYPVAIVKTGEYFAPVSLLQGQGQKGFLNPDAQMLQQEVLNQAEAQMEYQFASALQLLTRQRLPRIAYTVGRGQPTGPETYDLSRTLQSKYDFYLLNLDEQPAISDSIDAVLVVKPQTGFTDADKLKLDQYLMRGGNLLFLVDALNADMDSLRQTGTEFTAYARETNLEDLLFRYGVRINHDLVTDLQSDMLPQRVGSVGGQPQIELLPWPYFPLLYSQSNHPISKNLDAVVMQFPNSVDTVKAEGVNKTILLASSNTSRLVGTPVIVTVEILKELENPTAFKNKFVPLAVLLEGNFKSLYSNRMAGRLDSLQRAGGQPYAPASARPGKVLVTGDGDWVLNGMSREGPLGMGSNPYTRYEFANRDFLLNTLDYMTDKSGIMASRSKQFVLRLLDPKRVETEGTGWKWFNIGLPLLVLLLANGVAWWWRQKKYAVRT
jgi:gliding-associated putative ABC transporter substrate-binding component GldG